MKQVRTSYQCPLVVITVWCSGVGTLLQCQAMLGPGGTQEHGGLVICPAQNSDSHRGLSQVNMGTPRVDDSTVST